MILDVSLLLANVRGQESPLASGMAPARDAEDPDGVVLEVFLRRRTSAITGTGLLARRVPGAKRPSTRRASG